MGLVAFDTLKFANQLQAGNFTLEQAQAMTGAMVEAMTGAELATKHDIAAVKHDIAVVKHELEQKIDGVEHRLEQKILESQVSTQRFILTAFLSTVGLNAVMILGAMFGLAKLLGH